jgi:hypothetical protein
VTGDQQIWFQNTKNRWSLVSEINWEEVVALAKVKLVANESLCALVLTRDEWEAEPEETNSLINDYMEDIEAELLPED